MTYKEIREKFVSGEVVRVTFGIRKTYQVIGKTRITDLQYNKLRNEFQGFFVYIKNLFIFAYTI